MEKSGYKVRVTGIVQGVCFRYCTAQQAKKLNINGYAKNLYDGSVEVQMFGERAALQTLIEYLKQGPRSAIVESTQVDEIPYQAGNGFKCC